MVHTVGTATLPNSALRPRGPHAGLRLCVLVPYLTRPTSGSNMQVESAALPRDIVTFSNDGSFVFPMKTI